MLEISLKPRDRLIAMLKYSRPIGTDKKRRAFVVTRKVRSRNEFLLGDAFRKSITMKNRLSKNRRKSRKSEFERKNDCDS
jgi:hypothetical protein